MVGRSGRGPEALAIPPTPMSRGALSIAQRAAGEIDETTLAALGDDRIPESLVLEFKGELKLGPPKERREAAKDVSAMANTQGGRILYGISEATLSDGTKVAGGIEPLTDGGVIATLANILATTIHPQPLLTFHRVEVTGGFVLVADVLPSPTDVYMVTGYGENRYYRRGPTGIMPMSEPEVRQAYQRAAATTELLEVREKALVEPEDYRRREAHESILIVPVAPSVTHDPGQLESVRSDTKELLPRQIGHLVERSLVIESDGIRVDAPAFYLAVLKNGVVHLSRSNVFQEWRKEWPGLFSSSGFLHRLLSTLELARRVFGRSGYAGPVRIRHVLRASRFCIDANPAALYVEPPPHAPSGTYRNGPVLAYLASRAYSRIAKQLLDPLFHALGEPRSPLFDDDGTARPEARDGLPADLAALLD